MTNSAKHRHGVQAVADNDGRPTSPNGHTVGAAAREWIPNMERVGRFVELRPVTDADASFVYYVGSIGENLIRWRLRGQTSNPQGFLDFMWGHTDLQFIICRTDSGEPVGHVCTYLTDEASGITHVAAALVPEAQASGWSLEGLLLFFDFLFGAFPLRKIYLEVPGFNTAQFEGFVGRALVEEGRLTDRIFGFGKYHDMHILSLSRESWAELATSSVTRLFSKKS